MLWTCFCDKICDDLHYKLYQLGHTVVMQNEIYDFGLYFINNILHDSGHALSDFPSMLQSQLNWSDTLHNHQQMNFDTECEGIATCQFMSSLNADQQYAFREIWQSIIYDKGKIFFVKGFGGCGKMYLYQALCLAV